MIKIGLLALIGLVGVAPFAKADTFLTLEDETIYFDKPNVPIASHADLANKGAGTELEALDLDSALLESRQSFKFRHAFADGTIVLPPAVLQIKAHDRLREERKISIFGRWQKRWFIDYSGQIEITSAALSESPLEGALTSHPITQISILISRGPEVVLIQPVPNSLGELKKRYLRLAADGRLNLLAQPSLHEWAQHDLRQNGPIADDQRYHLRIRLSGLGQTFEVKLKSVTAEEFRRFTAPGLRRALNPKLYRKGCGGALI